jgi:exodeoxyribonuclease V gamma subunit
VLHVHRAERADGLVEALRELLARPLSDPFAPEVVAVPTRGMERWLTQRLSARLGAREGREDGVCANVDFPPPRRLVGDAVAAASGIEPGEDPWLPERAVWPLLEVVAASLAEPWLRELAAQLSGERRFTAVRHVAELFDRYSLQRPELVCEWAHGAGGGWQAELWRRLRTRIGVPSPAERLAGACARLLAEPGLAALPERIALFGLTRLPAAHLDVLRALAAARDVHLLLLHPSPALWERVAAATVDRPRIVRRREDFTAELPANRLLASWGQDARELQLVLGDGCVDRHHDVAQRQGTLLAGLQADVRADHPTSDLPPDDGSVQVHACHGRARQVEVLRDAILHALAEDPSLEPRDVIVMCPDIETFAPLIQATFGASGEDGGGPDLRVRLADRSLRQTNPVLGVVAQLLELAARRVTASQVLDLADREPVRRRFRLDDDDVARIQAWVADSGIRWGLDQAHRAPFKLDSLDTGTWRKGVDRLLLGVTMTEDEQQLFAGVLPLDDVESGAIDLAGRFAELVDRLRAAVDALSAPKPIDAWAEAIAIAADALTATGQHDAWQRVELQRVLDDAVAEAAGAATELALGELRSLLADRLKGRPTRANFRTGHLTVCTLVPMRSVPHRIVCLLGLDDGAFPRRAPRDGDDLIVAEPHVGDRDPRAEDRQMLLDALLAATDRLIVTYTGNDERSNARRPPAVPVGELMDVVGPRVEVRHPLQPFDPRNFTPGRLLSGRSWSFEPVMLAGAHALSGPRALPRPFLAEPLPPPAGGAIELEDLIRFVQHPVRAFLRQRLGVRVTEDIDELEDELRVELDGLAKWGVGQRLLEARLAGVEGRKAILAEIARGTLPPGVLGKPVVDQVFPVVEEILSEAGGPAAAAAGSVDVRVALGDGRTLTGTVPGVSGDELRTVTYSRVAAKHRLTSWVRLLALTAARPERQFSALTVGRSQPPARVRVACIRPLAREAALAHLATLADLYVRGMRRPLPLYCETSGAYAQAGAAAARSAWTSEWNFEREDREPEHELVLGGVLGFDELPAGLDRLAHALWDGLLACEEVSDR